MARDMTGKGLFLHDIKVRRRSPAYYEALVSMPLQALLEFKSVELVRLYQARVGKKTGRLAASAAAQVRLGGKRNDRAVGVVTIADETVASTWKGQPFYYGEYHEEGTMNSRRAKRRKADGARGPRRGYHELREAANEWRST